MLSGRLPAALHLRKRGNPAPCSNTAHDDPQPPAHKAAVATSQPADTTDPNNLWRRLSCTGLVLTASAAPWWCCKRRPQVLVRGRLYTVRGKGKSAFLMIRQRTATVQVRTRSSGSVAICLHVRSRKVVGELVGWAACSSGAQVR